jgi:hypothetical protein
LNRLQFYGNKFTIYSPLIVSELYLLFTVLLLYAGPIIWPIENQVKFTFLIALYHVGFVGGYILYVERFFKKSETLKPFSPSSFYLKYFYAVVFLSFLASLISHRNFVHTSSYIPWDFFSDLKRGLLYPAEVRSYYASTAYLEDFKGNKYVTALLLVLSVLKYSLLPSMIFLWDKLNLRRKTLGIIVAFIPIASGISISVSSINFSYVFMIAICLSLLVLQFKSISILKERLFFIFLFFCLMFFSFSNFYKIKTGSSFSSVASGKTVPARFDYLRDKGIVFKSDLSGTKVNAFRDLYEKLTVYLVNGYLGMSIALNEDFQSTYGLGHSVFLQRIADSNLGLNINERTFQHKITKKWDKHVFWHSAYSYFANDVGFFCVTFVMFGFGFYLAMVFVSALIEKNFLASLLLPLFGIFVLYIPANNQIFSFLETMASFWVLTFSFMYTKSSKKISNK